MKQSFIKGIKHLIPFFIAIIAFVILAGNKNPQSAQEVASKCCKGYSIPIDKLKKFMLDSLHTNRFGGGVFSKADLLAAINEIPGDSIYLMTVLKNCNLSRNNDLALTSQQAGGVCFVSKPGCYPCPPKSCCPASVCAASVDMSCLDFKTFQGLTAETALKIPSAEK